MAKTKKLLVLGSLAYDHLMQAPGDFKNVLIPENYNIAITAKDRKVFWGGCGGNIAYNLALLGQGATVFTSVGHDFDSYETWLQAKGIDTSALHKSSTLATAAAFIVTDPAQNQIIIFDAGAMDEVQSEPLLKNTAAQDFSWAIIAPDNPKRMLQMAKECQAADIPYLFDPGQQITRIPKEDLEYMLQHAKAFIVNEYEADLLFQKLGITEATVSRWVPIFIKTLGAKGALLKTTEVEVSIPSVPPMQAVDPTGCGDAFRAGVLMGLQEGISLPKACKIGALLATYNLESQGTQNHTFTSQEFAERFVKSFGENLSL